LVAERGYEYRTAYKQCHGRLNAGSALDDSVTLTSDLLTSGSVLAESLPRLPSLMLIAQPFSFEHTDTVVQKLRTILIALPTHQLPLARVGFTVCLAATQILHVSK